jgi:histidyl-tRNA synthetase
MPIKIPRAPRKAEKKQPQRSKKIGFQSVKGMHDILPEDFAYREKIEKGVKKIALFYGFERIEPPLLEDRKLYERGTGLSSEVVSKQMFTLRTKGGDQLALRPELTPGVVRAYVENGLTYAYNPGKFWYWAPMFRHEQPQAGRYRQFYQCGFEVLNSSDPAYHAQIIQASYRVCTEAKLKHVQVKLNSIGCKNCRPAYVRILKEYYKNKASKLCRDCAKRYTENPLRLLDCKEEKCAPFKADAPQSLDHLCTSCKRDFKAVLEYADELKVPYTVDTTLVRGLDYYTKTVFEIFIEGTDIALGGGGGYDYLSETLGGPRMPAVGSALGIERIIEAMKLQEVAPAPRAAAKIFLVYMGDQAKKCLIRLQEELFEAGIPAHEAFAKESLKAQLKVADKERAAYALIVGQREVFEEVVLLRDMHNGNQESVPMRKIVEMLKKKI